MRWELVRNLAATRGVESCMVAAHTGSRRYYVVGEGGTFRPRFDATLSLRANAVAIASWEWGERRAQWVGALVDELEVDDTADNVAVAEWVAAALCATAVDSGRDRKAGWNRTLTALSEMTGVSREAMLARFAQLRAIQQAS